MRSIVCITLAAPLWGASSGKEARAVLNVANNAGLHIEKHYCAGRELDAPHKGAAKGIGTMRSIDNQFDGAMCG